MKRRITMQDVADAVGMSRMSVSLALRGDPRVAEATRKRIQAKAREMGYRPNPMISVLMAHLRESYPGKNFPRIAYIVKSIPDWRNNPTLHEYYTGARDRCLELGFKLELFDLKQSSISEERLNHILKHRGITGVIIAPLHGDHTISLEWESFSSVAIGYSMTSPILNRVANHQFHTMLLALQQAREAGFRRPGLALIRGDNERVDQNWIAGLAVFQRSLKTRDRIPEYMPSEWDDKHFLQWLHKYQPDVILGLNYNLPQLLHQEAHRTGISCGFVSLSYNRARSYAGVSQNSKLIGSTAVDLVVESLHHNHRGIPENPRVTLIEGYWNNGSFYYTRQE